MNKKQEIKQLLEKLSKYSRYSSSLSQTRIEELSTAWSAEKKIHKAVVISELRAKEVFKESVDYSDTNQIIDQIVAAVNSSK